MEKLNASQIETLKNEGKKFLVQYTTPWCQPCKVLTPILEKFENNFPDIIFCKVDVEENMDYITDLGIRSVPTVMIHNGQELISQSVGVQTIDFYKSYLLSL
jgi:thioredoxin 1